MANSSKPPQVALQSNVWRREQGRGEVLYPTARTHWSASTRTEQGELERGGANIYSSIMWPREQADAPARPIHHRKVQTQHLLIGSQTLLQQRETGASTRKRSATVLWSWANPVTLKHTEKFDLGVSTQGSNWSELLFFLKQYPIPRAA